MTVNDEYHKPLNSNGTYFVYTYDNGCLYYSTNTVIDDNDLYCEEYNNMKKTFAESSYYSIYKIMKQM